MDKIIVVQVGLSETGETLRSVEFPINDETARIKIWVSREAVEHGVQSDKCPHCQHGLIVLQDKTVIDCIACGSTGIRR